jgi:hypothetical protein
VSEVVVTRPRSGELRQFGAQRGRDDAGDRGRVPTGGFHGLDQRPRLGLDVVVASTNPGPFGMTEGLPEAGQGPGPARPHLPGPQDGEHQVDPRREDRRGAEQV